MEEITYQQIIESQNKIIDYKQQIESLIGYVDVDGSRKIKPECFLSGEVAAYKFLVSWIKEMKQGEQVITKKVIRILDTIDKLIYWGNRENFNEQETKDNYEALSCDIWIDLLEDKDNAPSIEFNNLILVFAAMSLSDKGIPDEQNDYLNYSNADLLDGLALGEAYSVAHDWLLSLPRESFLKLMKSTELYRFHFHLLN